MDDALTTTPDDPPSPQGGGEEVAPGVFLPETALRFTFSRSSGPGGQNVNKLATKARLNVSLMEIEARIGPAATRRLEVLGGAAHLTDAGDLVITCQESRSQHANRRACLLRLREILVSALRVPKVRRRTRPTRSSRETRLSGKKNRARIKRQRAAPHDDV